jgi:hypothetical protein
MTDQEIQAAAEKYAPTKGHSKVNHEHFSEFTVQKEIQRGFKAGANLLKAELEEKDKAIAMLQQLNGEAAWHQLNLMNKVSSLQSQLQLAREALGEILKIDSRNESDASRCGKSDRIAMDMLKKLTALAAESKGEEK